MFRIFFRTLPKVASYPAYENLIINSVHFAISKLSVKKGCCYGNLLCCEKYGTNMSTNDWD